HRKKNAKANRSNQSKTTAHKNHTTTFTHLQDSQVLVDSVDLVGERVQRSRERVEPLEHRLLRRRTGACLYAKSSSSGRRGVHLRRDRVVQRMHKRLRDV